MVIEQLDSTTIDNIVLEDLSLGEIVTTLVRFTAPETSRKEPVRGGSLVLSHLPQRQGLTSSPSGSAGEAAPTVLAVKLYSTEMDKARSPAQIPDDMPLHSSG